MKMAIKYLEQYIVKYNVTFRGVPVSQFNKEELLKILSVYVNLMNNKQKTINLLSEI